MTDGNSFISNNLDSVKKYSPKGGEFWMARDIQSILGYSEWRNFESVIQKGLMACESSGVNPKDHFVKVNKMIVGGKGARVERVDYYLTRYASYLIAMNGDPGKPEIGLSQTYFAVQTRRMENIEALSEDERRLELRERVRGSNKKLHSAAKQSGVQNYALFHDAGYRGLYGTGQNDVKRLKGIPKNQALLDRAGRVELAANEFRITQCEEKLVKDKIKGQANAMDTHHAVGAMVRDTIQKIGGTMPEKLSPAPHIKEVKKRIKGTKSKAING